MKEFLVTFTGPHGVTFQQTVLADSLDDAQYCASYMHGGGVYFDAYVEECRTMPARMKLALGKAFQAHAK